MSRNRRSGRVAWMIFDPVLHPISCSYDGDAGTVGLQQFLQYPDAVGLVVYQDSANHDSSFLSKGRLSNVLNCIITRVPVGWPESSFRSITCTRMSPPYGLVDHSDAVGGHSHTLRLVFNMFNCFVPGRAFPANAIILHDHRNSAGPRSFVLPDLPAK